jgi:protoporphyrinogen oxidase
LTDVPVQARALAAQGLEKENLTEEEFRRVRKSLQTLGKRIRDKLEAEGNPIEAVRITVPGRRPGTMVHELAFRRKSGAKGVMS